MTTSRQVGKGLNDQKRWFLMFDAARAAAGLRKDEQDEKPHFRMRVQKKQACLLPCFLIVLLAAGCAAPPPPPAPTPTPSTAAPPRMEIVTITVPSEIDKFFSYYQGLRERPPGELRAELARLDAQPWTVWTALKKTAILSVLPGSNEVARTQALLDSLLYSSDPEAVELKPLLQLLSANFAERKRLIDQTESLHQQIREGQRRITQLNQMLEGLKAIERSLPAHSGDKAPEPRPGAK